eukprot:1938790-Pyramimonas_sp.AAC.1
MGSELDVSNEAEKIHVLLFRPLANATRCIANGAEKVVSGHSRSVQDLHQELRRNGLEHARLGRR